MFNTERDQPQQHSPAQTPAVPLDAPIVFLDDAARPMVGAGAADAQAETPFVSGTFSLGPDNTITPTVARKPGLSARIVAVPTRVLYALVLIATLTIPALVIGPVTEGVLRISAFLSAIVLVAVIVGDYVTYARPQWHRLWVVLSSVAIVTVIGGSAVAGPYVALLLIPVLATVVGHFRRPRSVAVIGLVLLCIVGAEYRVSGLRDTASTLGPANAAFLSLTALGMTILTLISFTRLYRDEITTFERAQANKAAEMAVAQEIQTSLMPPAELRTGDWTVVARSVAAQEVGGDFYEYIPYPGRKLGGVAIGDVAGKGIPAAIQMAVVRTVFRIEARRRIFPAETLMSVNVALQAERSFGMVTLLYAFVDPATAAVYVANAGHTYPLVLNADGAGSLTEMRLPGLPLGIDDEIEYSEEALVAPPGTRIILYTDGIVEAMNAKGEIFGDDRLRAVIQTHRAAAPDQLIGAIFGAVETFRAPAPQSDDLTVVVLCRDSDYSNLHNQ